MFVCVCLCVCVLSVKFICRILCLLSLQIVLSEEVEITLSIINGEDGVVYNYVTPDTFNTATEMVRLMCRQPIWCLYQMGIGLLILTV